MKETNAMGCYEQTRKNAMSYGCKDFVYINLNSTCAIAVA